MDSDPVQGDDSRYRVIHYPGADAARREGDARRAAAEPPQTDPPQSTPASAEPLPRIEPVPTAVSSSRWSPRNKALAGVGAAAVLGLGLGAVLMPKADKADGSDRQLAAATASHNPDDHLEIQVHNRPPPSQPVRTTGGKLDAASTVMAPAAGGAVASSVPDQQAQATPDKGGGVGGFLKHLFGGRGDEANADQPKAAAAAPARQTQVAVQTAPQPVRVQAAADPDDEDRADGPRAYTPRPQSPPWAAQPQPRPQPAAQTFPVRTAEASPSFDCNNARRPSEIMVCQVPSLAAADRRMARAYADARRAGVPSEMLKAQQQRWYRARERAAVSPQAVGMVYEQRIAELEQLRQQAGHTEDDGDNDW